MLDSDTPRRFRPAGGVLSSLPSMEERRSARIGRRQRTGARVLLLLAAASVMIWAWNSNPIKLRDRIFPRHLATVYPSWLYRSGQLAPNLVESTLAKLKIDVIVDLTHPSDKDAVRAAELHAANQLGIAHLSFPLDGDGTGDLDHYVGAVAAIARAERGGQRVLVHCVAGDRRTSGVIAAYQMLVRGEPAERAVREIGRFGSASPSAPLVRFLDENLERIARGLVERGVIAEVPAPLPRLVPTPSHRIADGVPRARGEGPM
jgi:protein-tyrosine phosphatase